MSETKQIAASLALAGAVGLSTQSQAATIDHDQTSSTVQSDGSVDLGERVDSSTLEEVILASGLHQQSGNGIDALLLGKDYKYTLFTKPSESTIEEVVLASGLHQQASVMQVVAPKPFNAATIKSGAQQLDIDKAYDAPDKAVLEEVLLASGLHQQGTVGLYDVDAATFEEIVLASGLHQQQHVFVYDDVTTAAIEEIVLASGLHQQGTTTIVLDHPDTVAIEEVVLASGLHQQGG